MKKLNYTLSSIINLKLKKFSSDQKGFEPVVKVKIGKTVYVFGIPFAFEGKKIKFQTSGLSRLFSFFDGLQYDTYAITTAYSEILEIKNVIDKKIDTLKKVITLEKNYLIEKGFLIESFEEKTIKTISTKEKKLNFEYKEENLSKNDVKNIKDKYNIKNIKNKSLEEFKNQFLELGLNETKNSNKTYFLTVLSKIGLKEKELCRELSKKEKLEIQKDVEELMNSIKTQ